MLENILTNVVVALIVGLFTSLFHKRKIIRIYFQSIIRWNRDIRLSYAYLFRIKNDNRYLLIKGNNISQYQPVGGVYKYYDSFNEKKLLWGISDEPEDNFYEYRDLRQKIKGKYLTKYIRWFESKTNREVNVCRALIDELDLTNVSTSDFVRGTEIEYIRTIRETIKFSVHFQVDEQKIFDIFEVRFSNEVLKEIITKNRNIVCVEIKDIEKRCTTTSGCSIPIAESAKYII